MAERVRITEVGPRDGLQNEPGVIPTASKARLVELCARSGVDEVEVTSFVSPKWVPQLGDAAEVFEQIAPLLASRWRGESLPTLSALVPNEAGLKTLDGVDVRLLEVVRGLLPADLRRPFEDWARIPAFITKLSVFTAASESFAKKNINATIDESLQRFQTLLGSSGASGRRVRGYISCVIACPFEGPIRPNQVARVANRLAEIGVGEIDLGDTIGAADVDSTVHLLEVLRRDLDERLFEDQRMTLHLHDTFGRAADCVKVALDLGVRSFDGSVAGLGGCPYASTPGKRAPGNIATETLVRTVHEAGYVTGVDLDRLAEAAAYAREIVGRSRAAAAAAAAASGGDNA